MENLVANLSGQVRTETLNDREFLVTPATLIVTGVLKGSRGALYYPSEEIAKNVSDWDGVPVLLDHPDTGGTARTPDVINRQGIGTVFNAVVEDGKLKAEIWFDVSNTKAIAFNVYRTIKVGQPVELSTGLRLKETLAPANSVFNGKKYTHTVSNFKPDHVAILSEATGACSLQDGCGILINKQSSGVKTMNEAEKKTAIDTIITNSCCHEEEDREVLNQASDDRLQKMLTVLNEQKDQTMVANKAMSDFEDSDGTKYVFNRETNTWNSTKKENKADKTKTEENGKKEEENVANNESQKPLTEEEWLASAPTGVQEDLEFARNERARQKQDLVTRLVANVKDVQEQARISTNFMKMTLNQLQDLAITIPEEKKPTPSYMGAATPATRQVTNSAEADFAPFGTPDEYLGDE